MSTIKISQLDNINTLNTTDILPVVNGGETKRMTVGKLSDIYATKQYVSNATSGRLIKANVVWGYGINASGEYPVAAREVMSAVINEAASVLGSYKTPEIIIQLDSNQSYYSQLEPFRITDKRSTFYFNEYGGSLVKRGLDDDPSQYQMVVRGSWDTGDFVASSVSRAKNIDYLSTHATTGSYTPRFDISPATKKYVDDAISTAITDALGGEY